MARLSEWAGINTGMIHSPKVVTNPTLTPFVDVTTDQRRYHCAKPATSPSTRPANLGITVFFLQIIALYLTSCLHMKYSHTI